MRRKKSIWFKLGLILLVVNYPLGIVSLWLTGAIFIKTRAAIWLAVGGGSYLFSWLLLLTGFMLTGEEGLRRIRFFWRRTRRRIKFLHLRINDEDRSGTPGNGV
ncbi:MAG: hypothetical protein HQ528_04770 [Candidatus Marinimicrobia bacterium]|nr:hypothetical protein [Candidatus Neomarinimicrobiota bacterium]